MGVFLRSFETLLKRIFDTPVVFILFTAAKYCFKKVIHQLKIEIVCLVFLIHVTRD